MTQSQQLSNCCFAPLAIMTVDEGTSFYTCYKCRKSCDPKPQEHNARICLEDGTTETAKILSEPVGGEQRRKLFFKVVDAIKLEFGEHSSLKLDGLIHQVIHEYAESARREAKEEIEQNIGLLRQALNEDRITDPKKLVTNQYIKDWLEL